VRVLVAGASGVIGRRLVRMLVPFGHRVTGTTRSPERAAMVRAVGATPLVVDTFNESRLGDAVASARPEVVAAAVRAGSRRLVAQSIAWAYARGPEPHPEADPLDTGAEGNRLVTVLGVTELERLVTSVPRLEGLVSRYGQLHGLGTWKRGAGRQCAPARRGRRSWRRTRRGPRRTGRLQHRGRRWRGVEREGARRARLGPGPPLALTSPSPCAGPPYRGSIATRPRRCWHHGRRAGRDRSRRVGRRCR
jgi:putative NAD(P)-binding protein